ncbi:MAG: hypothetical protein HKO03_03170 [Acidimicrobiia bacterium]|nr:hypothetical protein [Acidimicrobiia bacterium]
MDSRLLPAGDHAPRCTDWSSSIALDPRGTAFAADTVTFIATPGAWPKPVFAHPLLTGLAPRMDTNLGVTRNLTFRHDASSDDRVLVYVYSGPNMKGKSYLVPPPYLKDLVLHHDDRWLGGEPAPSRVLAVCTQGSHDVCCGTDGTRFAAEAAERDVTVLKVSHTGGHRFAPTALFVPDGRMWAHMDLALLDAILERSSEPKKIIGRCRGSISAPPGPGQVAECEILAGNGWEWRPASVSVDGDTVILRGSTGSYRVEVRPARVVPTVTCRADGGLPAKTRTEYEVTDVARLS